MTLTDLEKRVTTIEKDLHDVCKASADFIDLGTKEIDDLRRLLKLNMRLTAFLLTRVLGTLNVKAVVDAVNGEAETLGRDVLFALLEVEREEYEAEVGH
jgi:hypothetical protein